MSDVDEICRLKYRYVRLLDTKQWDEFANCFAPGATSDYGGLAFDSPEAHTGYERTYELTWSVDDTPSLKVAGPGAHTHA